MFGTRKSSSATPESQGWWPTDRTIGRLSSASRGALYVLAIVALYEFCMLIMQTRNFEKDLRLLPSRFAEWADCDIGTDSKRGLRVAEAVGSLFRKTRGPSEGEQSGRQEEQSSSLCVETGSAERLVNDQSSATERTQKRPFQNLGSSTMAERLKRRRTPRSGQFVHPRPHVEEPVILRADGTIEDPNISSDGS